MTEISFGAMLAVTPDEAFAFVSDPARWPLYVPGMHAAAAREGWGAAGGRGHMVNRFMGRLVTSELELTEWDEPRAFAYTMRQTLMPDIECRFVFQPVHEGATQLTGTNVIPERRGLAGLMDRIRVRFLQRVYDRAMDRLPEVIPHLRVGPAARI